MSRRIEDLLHRRSDLSTFLVHLTRDRARVSARDAALEILVERELLAKTMLGMGVDAARRDPAIAATQKVVCFTETPLEHVWMLCEDIEGRSIRFAPYGCAFTKTWARRIGVNPVMYIDITPGHNWLTNPINEMVAAAVDGEAVTEVCGKWVPASPELAPIFRIAPFFEQMGNPAGVRKEFWWEREWRHVGSLEFSWADLVAAFVPEDDHDEFEDDFFELLDERGYATPKKALRPRLLDPRWGLERMIAELAGVSTQDARPFPNA